MHDIYTSLVAQRSGTHTLGTNTTRYVSSEQIDNCSDRIHFTLLFSYTLEVQRIDSSIELRIHRSAIPHISDRHSASYSYVIKVRGIVPSVIEC